MAELERHASVALHAAFAEPGLADASRRCDALAAQLAEELVADGADHAALRVSRRIDLRYRGVEAAIGVELLSAASARPNLRPPIAGSMATCRLVDRWRLPPRGSPCRGNGHRAAIVDRTRASAAVAERHCKAWFAGREVAMQLFDRAELRPGDSMVGPAIVCEQGSTVVIDPGWTGQVLSEAELLLRRSKSEGKSPSDAAEPSAIFLARQRRGRSGPTGNLQQSVGRHRRANGA